MMQKDEIAENSGDKDINDVFEDIFLVEERAYTQGFKEGVEVGQQEENLDAFHLGYHKGAEIGAEIGYYSGVTKSYLTFLQSGDDKIVKDLSSLKKLLDDFPRENNKEVDFNELLSQIRAKFKKLCALLKIKPNYPPANQLAF